ncbi:major coat protein [Spongiibacter tropicus]|uniref:major coat protein n=1 Tax=Spongiibacter tropicus TaxID=454602 RepID=UPI0025921653|nr:major coat protein [uncultured Spongiibacter sp.]
MKNAKTMVGASVLGAVSMMAMSAHAALPTEATAAMTAIGTGVSDAEAAAWPIIGAALVAGIVIKLVKRFANKV